MAAVLKKVTVTTSYSKVGGNPISKSFDLVQGSVTFTADGVQIKDGPNVVLHLSPGSWVLIESEWVG